MWLCRREGPARLLKHHTGCLAVVPISLLLEGSMPTRFAINLFFAPLRVVILLILVVDHSAAILDERGISALRIRNVLESQLLLETIKDVALVAGRVCIELVVGGCFSKRRWSVASIVNVRHRIA